MNIVSFQPKKYVLCFPFGANTKAICQSRIDPWVSFVGIKGPWYYAITGWGWA